MTGLTAREQVENFMEKLVFQDKENLKSDSLITAYKHPTTNKITPIVKYFWTIKSWYDYPSLEIEIQCPDKETYKKTREAQEMLCELGIEFFTGYGSGSRHWDFDKNLSGYHFIRKDNTEEYEFIGVPPRYEGDLPPLELVHDVHINKDGVE